MAKFYKCPECDIIAVPDDAEVTITCHDDIIDELKPNTTDAAGEKHVPKVTVDDNKVTVEVGEVYHPMLDEHYIDEVFLETNKGFYRKNLKPNDEPVAVFILDEEEVPVKAYEYCTLHGLWEKAI